MKKDNFDVFIEATSEFFPSSDVRFVFEMGGHKCTDTIRFYETFPLAEIYTFECNQETLPICKKAIESKKRIHLTEKAVSDINGPITFYPIDTKKTKTIHKDGNPGASSIFKASGKYPVENYVQNETTVQSTRLDTFMNEHRIGGIDVLWLDTQGAELKILQGLGKKLRTVRIINTEVEFMDIYSGQPLFKDIKKFLTKNGFKFYKFTYKGQYFADAVFVNNDLVNGSFGSRAKFLKRKAHALVSKVYKRIKR